MIILFFKNTFIIGYVKPSRRSIVRFIASMFESGIDLVRIRKELVFGIKIAPCLMGLVWMC